MKQSTLALSALLLATPVASFAPVATFVLSKANSPTFLQTSLLSTKEGSFDITNELSGKGTLKITFQPDGEKPAPAPQGPPSMSLPTLAEVFPKVGLPEGKEPERFYHPFTAKLALGAGPLLLKEPVSRLVNQEKDNSQATFDKVAEMIIKFNKYDSAIPENMKSSYKFFGNDNSAENLKMLLKTNPFMAPALQSLGDGKGFELKSWDPDGIEEPTLYQKIIGELAGVGRRVNIQFDSKMERIDGFQMYDDATGLQERQSDIDIDLVASAAIYNIFAFAQAVHATIHVLHYVYTSAFQVASKDAEFEPMNQWANDYATHIPEKYWQVGSLLITDRDFKLDPFFGPESTITGANGLGFRQESTMDAPIRGVLKQMLQDWAENPSADGFYMGNMMKNTNINTEDMDSAGILTEFRKHVELSKKFAAGTCEALEKTDSQKFNTAEKNLGSYLKACGELKSGLTSINQWVEMMAVTGTMHGSTLSYTRVLLKPEVMRWREKKESKWNTVDEGLIAGTLLTMFGMDDGTHAGIEGGSPNSRVVMGKSNLSGDRSNKMLQHTLDEFNEAAITLKTDYKNEIMRNPMFNDYGWILSDWCPDSFDGKQLTIATYI